MKRDLNYIDIPSALTNELLKVNTILKNEPII